MDFNLHGQWQNVSGAPLIFLGTVLVVALAVWGILHFVYQERIERLRTDAESERAEVQRLKTRLDEFKDKLDVATPDEAKARIAKLEAKLKALAPRRLDDGQKRAITHALSVAPGQSVSLAADRASQDAGLLTRDIQAAMQSAGWFVMLPMLIGNEPWPKGVTVIVSEPAQLTPPQMALVDAFRNSDLDFRIVAGPPRFNPGGADNYVADILIS